MSTALSMRETPKPDLGEDTGADGTESQEGNQNQYVTFVVAGEMFAVPVGPVQEIIRMPAVSHLPLAPRVLDGLANLRGRVLPIVNLRRLFGCEERSSDDATRALVIHIGQPLGFVVDRVASVVTIDAAEIEPADSIQSIVNADYLIGVIKHPRAGGDGHDMLLSIDFARLIEGQFAGLGGEARGQRADAAAIVTVATAGDAGREDGRSADELRLVSFSVADQEYALDIAAVQEIVQLPATVSVLPNAPGHVLGVISLRQRLLPLVSLRTLFGLPPMAYSEQQRIVVTTLPGELRVGLVTDAVKEVLSVPRAMADPMPGLLVAGDRLQEFSAVCRLDGGKRLVSILATDKLLRLPGTIEALDAAHRMPATPADKVAPTGDESGRSEDQVDAASDDDDMQVVIFRLGAEEFGVPIMSVQEIVRVPEALTRVPRTPAFVEGVINLRGTVLPVIDQRSRLGLPPATRHERQRIMVYLLSGQCTGFIVDSVAEVLRIPLTQIVAAPAMSHEQGRLISRVAKVGRDHKRLVLLIDPAHLLRVGEVQAIGQLGQAGATADAPPVLPLAA